jgi:hypothetical protein
MSDKCRVCGEEVDALSLVDGVCESCAQKSSVITDAAVEDVLVEAAPVSDRNESHALRGVKGWLKFFVIVNIYVAPSLFVIGYILAWIGFVDISDRYPGIILVGVIETLVGGFFVLKWIQIAIDLKNIRPHVIQYAKVWLKYSLAWGILNAPLIFLSGMPADNVMPGAIKSVVQSLISFAIWYSYFSVSKRVKATYPDWDE